MNPRSPWLCLLSLVFVAIHAAPNLGADAPPAEAKPVPAQRFPAGIIDSAGKIGYVHNDEKGVTAVDLASGKELWKSSGPMWPLMGVEGDLFALIKQDHALHMLWLDPATGKERRASQPIVLPSWAKAPIGLNTRAGLFPGHLLLEWLVVPETQGGARPPTDQGRVKIDLATGKIALVPANERLVCPAPIDRQTIGGLTYSVLTRTTQPHPHFVEYQYTLRAVDKDGKLVWERRLPTVVVGPPKP